MAITSVAENIHANEQETGLFATGRYRPDNPLRLRQAANGYETVPRRVYGEARGDRFVHTTGNELQTGNGSTVSNTSNTTGRERAHEALNTSGFTGLAEVTSRVGAGTLRSGSLFGITTPTETAVSSFGATLELPITDTALTDAFQTTANLSRQVGSLRLNQGAIFPTPSMYDQVSTEPGGFGLLATLTASPVTTFGNVAGEPPASALYNATGSVLEQTPRLLTALFA